MNFLKVNKTYAVVDLETTGTSLDGSQRIIQFACVLVEDGKIVNQFNTLINPYQHLSNEVKRVTGLKDKDLKTAPSFDEVAGTIYALLQETVFVAHDIHFDYRFLNLELQRVGYPALELLGIDTLQLAQILLPTQISYRLGHLTHALKIRHDNPHHADSDAYVTAKLLLILLDKIKQLPKELLVTLSGLGQELIYDTGLCFKWELDKRIGKEVLANDLLQVEGLILKRPHFETGPKLSLNYPQTDQEKRQQFAGVIDFRPEQVKLMDDLYDFSHSQEKYFLAQAPTGLGKSLGYLYPATYWALNGRKVVIAVPTNSLQEQLVADSIPVIEELIGQLRVVVLKGNQNYLNLEKFWHSLKQEQTMYARLLQLKILVWLTQTQTGDLSELNLLNTEGFISRVKHQGIGGLDQTSPFFQVDFVRRQEIAVKNADIIVTNQAYLINHASEFASLEATLILDEAQHLIDLAANYNRQVIDLDAIKIWADSLAVKMQSQTSLSFDQLVATGFLTDYNYQQLLRQLRVIDHGIMDVRSRLIQYFYQYNQANEVYIPLNKLRGFIKAHLGEIKQIGIAFEKFSQLNAKLERAFRVAVQKQALTRDEATLLLDYFNLVDRLNHELAQWQQLDLNTLEAKDEQGLTWLSLNQKQSHAHLRINFGLLEGKNYLATKLYQQFFQVILIGASVFTEKTQAYVLDQLDLPAQIKLHSYVGAFDYQKQAQVLVASDAVGVTQSGYSKYLAQMIYQLVTAVPKQTMVLFNSLEMIDAVYQELNATDLRASREVLAQGIHGSINKIKKRFTLSRSKNSVLLATGSFFEGIDLPKDKLEMVIVTRLPFTPPDSIYNQVRYQRVKQAGQNPFSNLALPEAIIKLKQAFGRLIRTPDDRGVFILLDSRFVTKRYGREFMQAFPEDCPPKLVTSQALVQSLKDFWQK